MTGLDTNVLVRYVMQDDARQAPVATRCIEALTATAPGFVSTTVIVEFWWVLASAYGVEPARILEALAGLARSKEIVVESQSVVWQAIRAAEAGDGDFVDTLIERSGAAAGCARTVTFDRRAARQGGMTLLS